ncbi:MAG: hypothetical protein WC369_02190 [Dehalococcoidales bacterium]|jgi:hypothetical protein
MKCYAKCIVGIVSTIFIVGAVSEGEKTSPGKIEPHAEVETIYEYPNSSLFTSVVASTTMSGDVAFSTMPKMCLKRYKSLVGVISACNPL